MLDLLRVSRVYTAGIKQEVEFKRHCPPPATGYGPGVDLPDSILYASGLSVADSGRNDNLNISVALAGRPRWSIIGSYTGRPP